MQGRFGRPSGGEQDLYLNLMLALSLGASFMRRPVALTAALIPLNTQGNQRKWIT